MYKIACVLLVEDDPITQFVALKAIKTANYFQEIKACKTGEDALEYLTLRAASNDPAPELIFFDINLPGLSGYDFYKKILKLPFSNKSKMICCVVTNSSHSKDKDIFNKLGVQEYLMKPLLKEVIDQIYVKYFIKK